MRTAHIALKVEVDDTKLVGHSAHLKELAALLKAVSIQGTTTFTGMAASAGISADSLRKLGRQIAGLNAAVTDMATAITKYGGVTHNTTNIVNQNTLALTQNNLAIQKNTQNNVDLAISIEKASKAVERKIGFVQRWGYALTRAAAIVRSIGYLSNEFFSGLQRSAERIDLTNTLTNQFDDLEGKIEQIKFKTANMIDRESILRSMALMSSFNLPMQNFAEQVELVNKMTIRTGQSVQYMMDSFARGISRLSAPILDNLGIQVVLKDVYAEFAISVGKSTDELTKFEKQAAVTNYVLGVMQEKTAGIELQETIAAQVRSVKNEFTELSNEITDWLTGAAVTIGDAFSLTFGDSSFKSIRNIKFSLSEVAKELVELKKAGVAEDDERYIVAKRLFDQFKEEVEFVGNNLALYKEISTLKEILAEQDADTVMYKDRLYNREMLEIELSILDQQKDWLKNGPKVVKDYYNNVFAMLTATLGDEIDPKIKESVQKGLERFINTEVPKVIKNLKGTINTQQGIRDLWEIFFSPPEDAKFIADDLRESFLGIVKASETGLAKQNIFETINNSVVEISNGLIRAAQDANILAEKGSATAVSLDQVKEKLQAASSSYKDAVREQEKLLKMEDEHDDKIQEKLAAANARIVRESIIVSSLEKQVGILDRQLTIEKALEGQITGIYSVYEKKLKTLTLPELKAEEAKLKTAEAKYELELISMDLQIQSTEMVLDSMQAVTTTLGTAMMVAAVTGALRGNKEADLDDARVRLELARKVIAEAKRGLKDLKNGEKETPFLTLEEMIEDESEVRGRARQRIMDAIKAKNEIAEELGGLIDKLENTKDVREIDKIFLAYKKLEMKAHDAGISMSQVFSAQELQIRSTWQHANAIYHMAQAYTDVAEGANLYKSVMGDFIGADWQDGIAQFATGMENIAEAIMMQADSYTKLSAVTGLMQAFTNTIIKDKRKLAWVNMVFEVAKAWEAWATPGMQHLAVGHSIAAATYGLIGGGVLKLPAGTSSVGSKSSRDTTPPPIIINVVGDIAQTEADRGVMIQRSLDEARRMGRI